MRFNVDHKVYMAKRASEQSKRERICNLRGDCFIESLSYCHEMSSNMFQILLRHLSNFSIFSYLINFIKIYHCVSTTCI